MDDGKYSESHKVHCRTTHRESKMRADGLCKLVHLDFLCENLCEKSLPEWAKTGKTLLRSENDKSKKFSGFLVP